MWRVSDSLLSNFLIEALLLVINPGPGYLTRIRARLPGRVRDANPDRDTPGAP